MTESERLKELLLKCDPIKDRDLDDDWGDGEIDDIVDSLLENGVIVPPCKVGDTVYIPYISTVIEKKVCSIVFQKPFYTVYCGGTSLRFSEEDFGKTVFLTRDEAEKALGERSDKA